MVIVGTLHWKKCYYRNSQWVELRALLSWSNFTNWSLLVHQCLTTIVSRIVCRGVQLQDLLVSRALERILKSWGALCKLLVLFLSPCNMRKRWRIYLLPSRWRRARHPHRHCNCPCRRVWSDTAPRSDQRRCRELFIPGTLTWGFAAFFVVYFSNLLMISDHTTS